MYRRNIVNIRIIRALLLFLLPLASLSVHTSQVYAIFSEADMKRGGLSATPAPGEPPAPGSPEASTSPTPAKTPAADDTVNSNNKVSNNALNDTEDVSENQKLNKLDGWEWLAAGALGVVVLAGVGWVVMGRRKK